MCVVGAVGDGEQHPADATSKWVDDLVCDTVDSDEQDVVGNKAQRRTTHGPGLEGHTTRSRHDHAGVRKVTRMSAHIMKAIKGTKEQAAHQRGKGDATAHEGSDECRCRKARCLG